MSKVDPKLRISTQTLRNKKAKGEKFAAITCYDSAFGKLIQKTDIEVILVGDSMGNVILGFENTIPVTVDHIVHHTAAVARTLGKQMLVADMPFMSYGNVTDALKNAARMMQEGGAHAVKLEGGEAVIEQVRTLISHGIPVMGHLGLTPQSVHTIGGYRVQGKSKEDRDRMLHEAKLLEKAGAFALVLEMVPSSLARDISKSLSIPVIGIGAGSECDGQVLVLHDLLGFDEEFSPKFLKRYANLGKTIVDALNTYDREVKGSAFPDPEHSFHD